MIRTDRFFTVLTLVCAFVAGVGAWGIWGDGAGQFIAGVNLRSEIIGDPRYEFIEALEAEYPGIYAVDVKVETDATGREWLRAYLMFDRRITSEFGKEPGEDGQTPIYRYVGEATAWISEYADARGYDRLEVAFLFVGRMDVLGGKAWQATTIMAVWGDVVEFARWADEDGTNINALMERSLYTNRIAAYSYNPFYPPDHHNTYLERPFAEPLWVTLERWEAEK